MVTICLEGMATATQLAPAEIENLADEEDPVAGELPPAASEPLAQTPMPARRRGGPSLVRQSASPPEGERR
jgi:hypothetical protein